MQDERTASEPKRVIVHSGRKIVLEVGARLGIDAFSDAGVLLLREGQIIEDRSQLARLLEDDVRFGLRPGKAEACDESPEEDVPELRPVIPENFQSAYAVKSEAILQVRGVFDRIEETGELDLPEVESTVCGLMDQVVSDGLAIAALTQIKEIDSYTYCHSVNVAVLAMYLALATQCEDRIMQIGLGGLLHDVGKLSVPRSVLGKRGPLSDDERGIIQQHPDAGARLIRNSGCADPIVLSCVQDHHERLTGGGYPLRKPASQIGTYAKLISLADVFDALTTDRPYRKAMTPDVALTLMVEQMGGNFDPWMLHRFIEVAGHIADQTYITPDGEVALKETSVGALTEDLIRKTGSRISGFNAAA